MINIVKLPKNDRTVLFSNTASKMGLNPIVVEKDYWVCYTLDYLFHRSKYKNAFIFKGGTSLSKAYNVIKRFSEDIDLILDWNLLSKNNNPWENRSKNQQDKFNKELNDKAAIFIKDQLLPSMINDLSSEITEPIELIVDDNDILTILFKYPAIYNDTYIKPEIRLEIGPLAEWTPNHKVEITPNVADYYKNIFENTKTLINTVDVERTFWEKITILHKIANRDLTKPFPRRYARHYYDVYNMSISHIKFSAFSNKQLLSQDITFKMKFYYSKNSSYETCKLGSVRLVPQVDDFDNIKEDYEQMKKMICGSIPSFDEIIKEIQNLEKEINSL